MAHLTAPWPDADQKVLAWVEAHKSDRQLVPNTGEDLRDIYKNILRDGNNGLADGPLISLVEDLDDDDEITAAGPQRSPALHARGPDHRRVLTPRRRRTSSSGKRYARISHGTCWTRLGASSGTATPVVDRLADYLEMRGIAVKPCRADADPPEPEPSRRSASRPRSRTSTGSAWRVSASDLTRSDDRGRACSAPRPTTPRRSPRRSICSLPSDDYAKVVGRPRSICAPCRPPGRKRSTVRW